MSTIVLKVLKHMLFLEFYCDYFFKYPPFCTLSLQTFVNDVRIQEQMYITLKLEDKLRFGYDILH